MNRSIHAYTTEIVHYWFHVNVFNKLELIANNYVSLFALGGSLPLLRLWNTHLAWCSNSIGSHVWEEFFVLNEWLPATIVDWQSATDLSKSPHNWIHLEYGLFSLKLNKTYRKTCTLGEYNISITAKDDGQSYRKRTQSCNNIHAHTISQTNN